MVSVSVLGCCLVVEISSSTSGLRCFLVLTCDVVIVVLHFRFSLREMGQKPQQTRSQLRYLSQ